eukprot:scaffold382_cov380-Prasinococcus_capsulatus_cf.AAC.18
MSAAARGRRPLLPGTRLPATEHAFFPAWSACPHEPASDPFQSGSGPPTGADGQRREGSSSPPPPSSASASGRLALRVASHASAHSSSASEIQSEELLDVLCPTVDRIFRIP